MDENLTIYDQVIEEALSVHEEPIVTYKNLVLNLDSFPYNCPTKEKLDSINIDWPI